MVPAGFHEEKIAEDAASEYGVPVGLARLVVLLEEDEEDVRKREERLLLLVKIIFAIDLTLTEEQIGFLFKVSHLLSCLID